MDSFTIWGCVALYNLNFISVSLSAPLLSPSEVMHMCTKELIRKAVTCKKENGRGIWNLYSPENLPGEIRRLISPSVITESSFFYLHDIKEIRTLQWANLQRLGTEREGKIFNCNFSAALLAVLACDHIMFGPYCAFEIVPSTAPEVGVAGSNDIVFFIWQWQRN